MSLDIVSKKMCNEKCSLKVKLQSGSSIVKIKPLFAHDSKSILVANGCDVKVFSINSGECTHVLKYHKTSIVSLSLNKNNPLQVFTCSEDGIVVKWDYYDEKRLQIYDLKANVVAFYAPLHTYPWYILTKKETNVMLCSIFISSGKIIKNQLILNVLPKENAVAFGYKGKFIATIYENSLNLYDCQEKRRKSHKTGTRNLVCVNCHPSDCIVATGDDQGQILIWTDMLVTNHPVRSIYHWHTLPVADLVFSSEGSYIYSGGGEATLLKWKQGLEKPHTIPRLGLPICHLVLAHDNSYIALAHEDNALQILNSQFTIIQIIQGLTQGHFQGSQNKNIAPTGMLYDPRTKALVMNGKPGHLQFYKINEDKQLFNLDIVGRNFITQERYSIIINTDVYKTAFDDNGYWLATIEYRDDGKTSPEIILKFWQFDLEKQTYNLNTHIILPHNKEVNCIKFQPFLHEREKSPLVVTTSSDKKFKIWTLIDEKDSKQTWTCEFVGYYRDLPAGDACFSEDGSLLAIAFKNVLTLWTTEDREFKAELFQENINNDIRQVIFGRLSDCHLLLSQNTTNITAWNVLTLSVHWNIYTEVQWIVADLHSETFAVFCQNQNLIIFQSNDPSPIFSLEHVSNNDILSAIFIPNDISASEDCCWHKRSQLYFLDTTQTLFTLTDEAENINGINLEKIMLMQSLPITPYGMLQAEKKVSNIKRHKPVQHIISNKEQINENMVIIPSQNPIALCSSILSRILIPSKFKDKKNEFTSSNNNDNQMIIDSDSDNEKYSFQNKLTNINFKPINDSSVQNLSDTFIKIKDYSFLKEIIKFVE